MVSLAVVGVVAFVLGAHGRQEQQGRERGRAIFVGEADLPGRLAGHPSALPRLASRCMNCHQAIDAPLPSTAAAPAGRDPPAGRTFAAPLDRHWLASPRSRHGGPPTTYDAAAFCAVLRDGVDAGQVMVSTAMPRYAPSDAQCRDLLTYLLSR